MTFRRPPAYARNDVLTPGNYSQLRTNNQELQAAFRAEHVEATGEHNTLMVPRAVGTARSDSGPAWTLIGFNSDVSAPAVYDRDLYLNLAAGRYEKDGGPVQVQNASDRGPTRPTLSMARWFDDTRVEVMSSFWGGTLGVSGSGFWAGTGDDSGHFHLSVTGRLLSPGAFGDFGGPLLPRQGLRSPNVGQLVQGAATLEGGFRVAHTAGAHDIREIAKGWAHVQWTGSAFSIIDQHVSPRFDGGYFTTAALVSTGIVDVLWAAPLNTTNYQVFIDVDYSRMLGDPNGDYYLVSAPLSTMTKQGVRLFIYKRLLDGAGVEYFDRGNAIDFHLWLYDNH